MTFEAPAEANPDVRAAVAGYEDLVRQFVIAEGLGQPEYPPLLRRIDPRDPKFVEAVILGPRRADAKGKYVLGPVVDRVFDVGGGGGGLVIINSCTDYSGRYYVQDATDRRLENVVAGVVPIRATMTRGAKGWLLTNYTGRDDGKCA